ncbi:MAG: hypothetical protein KKH88_02435 [Nanoarchaeota archaeon]|nr:hypothetical protein [Nanoarchaeota archaeon]
MNIIKANAVPEYARKLVSGSRKKNNTNIPTNITIGIKYCFLILTS